MGIQEYVKGAQISTEKVLNGQSWKRLSNEINKLIVEYKLYYKINIHESVLI